MLEDSVASGQRLLALWNKGSDPEQWAGTQNNLGNALRVLGGQAGSAERLDEAVAAFRAALEVYTREQFPVDWAMTQNNLGTALQTLGEQAAAQSGRGVGFPRGVVYTREQSRWTGLAPKTILAMPFNAGWAGGQRRAA